MTIAHEIGHFLLYVFVVLVNTQLYQYKSDYSYTSRRHTRTPNASKEQGDSWVVQRDRVGIGYGKNAGPAKHEILVGKNKWVSKKRMAGGYTSKEKRYCDK